MAAGSAYPNPISGNVRIRISNFPSVTHGEIINAMGSIIFSAPATSEEVVWNGELPGGQSCASGMYVVNIYGNRGLLSQNKIMKP
ncbi:MAG: T9SS type A sorting domain-containing protein [Chryseolinea sp.]